MASRFRRRKDVPAHTLLGVAEGAETEELNRAASQLRDHIVERQTHSDEEPFREALELKIMFSYKNSSKVCDSAL